MVKKKCQSKVLIELAAAEGKWAHSPGLEGPSGDLHRISLKIYSRCGKGRF